MCRGYWGIGVFHCKSEVNIGTLWRSADAFGAAFVFTVGRRYQRQSSDTVGATRHIPLYNYAGLDDLIQHLPYGCPLVGIEFLIDALPLRKFHHPAQACYLRGAEDHGLGPKELQRCHSLIVITGASACLNVASAGTVVMYDRAAKAARLEAKNEPG